jgi:hypothetical protein
MTARLNLFAHASICIVFLAAFLVAPMAAGAEDARVKVAVTETSRQTAGPAGAEQRPPRDLQVAQCESGRDDCQTRPQAQCRPGLDACLSLGQSECKNLPAATDRPGPNTTGLDNALKNPGLSPEQRASLLKTKAAIEASRQRVASSTERFQYSRCLLNVTKECRATHC